MFVPAGAAPTTTIFMLAPASTFKFNSNGSVGLFTVTEPLFPTYVIEDTVAAPVTETLYCKLPAADVVIDTGLTVHVFGVSFLLQLKKIATKANSHTR
jgi:hypothetical protein